MASDSHILESVGLTYLGSPKALCWRAGKSAATCVPRSRNADLVVGLWDESTALASLRADFGSEP